MSRSVRFVALLAGTLALGACGARHASGPAWPKTAAAETDGGESLAPRQPAAIAVADAGDDDDEAEDPASTVMPTTVVPGSPAATTPAATPAAPEDPITVEEIVIEIDDD